MKKAKFIHLSTVFPQWMAFLLVFILSISLVPTIAFKTNKTTTPAQAAWPTGATTFDQAVNMTDGIRRDGNNYYISTATGLNLLSDFKDAPDSVDKNWNSAWTFYLENDIDMSAYPSFTIGTEWNEFTGTFDGQGHSITMKTSMTTRGKYGLFAWATVVTIKNLTIKGSIASSQVSDIGAFIGYASFNSIIEVFNCRNEATISSEGSSGIGGCIGSAWNYSNISITNFVNVGNLRGSNVGGVIGSAKGDLRLTNIYVESKLQGRNVGGLIGVVYVDSNNKDHKIKIIEAAINTQLVSKDSSLINGCFIGKNYSDRTAFSFVDCYFNGTGSSYLVPSGGTTTYQGVFDGEHKTYYPGFDNSKWVTGVNEGTAGLRSMLAIGSLAPVNDVESYLVSKGFTKAA